MIIVPQVLPGVLLITPEPAVDERGFFARLYSREEFATVGLPALDAQISISRNTYSHTLRGLHYQRAPHEEVKLVRCIAGSLVDVVVDLRAGTPSFGTWLSVELEAHRLQALLVPQGCAHGFLTLEPDTDVLYQMSTPFVAAASAGIRWDDPAVGVTWPAAPVVISDRDRRLPGLAEEMAAASMGG